MRSHVGIRLKLVHKYSARDLHSLSFGDVDVVLRVRDGSCPDLNYLSPKGPQ